MSIMDVDYSGSIDRIEWCSYLNAPKDSSSLYQLGNMDYYDFDMREFFDTLDTNGDGLIDLEELKDYVKRDLGEYYSVLDEMRRVAARPLIEGLARFILKELKQLASEVSNPNVQPNYRQDCLTWVEFMRFKQVGKMQKVEVQTELGVLHG